jgi:hypothetical protein
MGHARLPRRSGSSIRPAAPARVGRGSAGGQVQHRIYVSHFHGSCPQLQLQLSIITGPGAVSRPFHQALRLLTGPHQQDDHHLLTCVDRTRRDAPYDEHSLLNS